MFNEGYTYREQISSGVPVLEHLLAAYPHGTEIEWRARIQGGEVRVDGAPTTPGTELRPGQCLEWHRPPWEEPPVPEGCDILYEDDWVVAACKPRGLPTLPGAGFLQGTLLYRVQQRYPQARPMHRLGRETSGVVLFALTPQAAASLQAAWRAHALQKTYRALSQGRAEQDAYEIRTPIGPVPHPKLGTLHAASPAGKASLSRARVLERRETSTLFEVEILTGRPHQIRIHLACIGHPLVGDPLYGAGGHPHPDGLAVPGDGGYFLHAHRLRFLHPGLDQWMECRAEPPPELACGA